MDQNFILPHRPSVIKALANGFKTMAAHAYLIVIPIIFDLLLLLSPHLTIEKFLTPALKLIRVPNGSSPEITETIQASLKTLLEVAKDYSVTTWLRTLPFGLPSLMASRVGAQTPLGPASVITMNSLLLVIALFMVFTVVGILLAALYYNWNANMVFPKDETVHSGFIKKTGNLLLIPLICLVSVLILAVPLTIVLGLSSIISPFLGSVLYFIALIALINLLFPLLFTPHAIIVGNKNLIEAAKESVFIFKKSGVFASFFVVALLFATYFSERLWQTPPSNSWMVLIGIFGHAVISTALVLASFHFFKDAKGFAFEMAKLLNTIGESDTINH
ncbi:MAG: hypothetical protein VB108_04030 [Anaerolineaceae bacterium]|nr:hypothetical protein [Anaerolineaceae bacterium]